jgi:small subunit ribosomal protein S16
MSVKIRLARHGGKKHAHYRVVVADTRSPRDGRNLAEIGTYNPHKDPAEVEFDAEKVSSWLKKGATPTPTVASLLKKAGLSS